MDNVSACCDKRHIARQTKSGNGITTKKDFYFGAVSRILGSLGKARYSGEMTPRET